MHAGALMIAINTPPQHQYHLGLGMGLLIKEGASMLNATAV